MITGIRGIAYDLDGTITDTVELHEAAWTRAADGLGIALTPDFLADQKGRTTEDAAARTCEDPDMAAKLGDAKRYHASLLSQGPKVHESFFSTVAALRARDIQVQICTSAPESCIGRLIADDQRFASFQDQIVFREMYEKGKPDPEPLLLTFMRMKLPSEECLYVGDAYTDYQAAVSAGCGFIYFCPQGGREPRIPETVPTIATHSDLLALLA